MVACRPCSRKPASSALLAPNPARRNRWLILVSSVSRAGGGGVAVGVGVAVAVGTGVAVGMGVTRLGLNDVGVGNGVAVGSTVGTSIWAHAASSAGALVAVSPTAAARTRKRRRAMGSDRTSSAHSKAERREFCWSWSPTARFYPPCSSRDNDLRSYPSGLPDTSYGLPYPGLVANLWVLSNFQNSTPVRKYVDPGNYLCPFLGGNGFYGFPKKWKNSPNKLPAGLCRSPCLPCLRFDARDFSIRGPLLV